jgi:muconate cycloisomerase
LLTLLSGAGNNVPKKISRIETVPVNVPLRPGWTTKTAGGVHVRSPYVIVRIHTDQGLIGLGEATLAARWSGETSPGCIAAIHGLIAPALVGQDPTQITRLRGILERVIRFNPFTKAALEMALWDIVGKARGVPVYELLGGDVHPSIPTKMVVGAFDVPTAVALAQRFLDGGARCLKVKVGLDPQADLQRVRAVRKAAGPEIPIGIDANQGWSRTTARRMLAVLADCQLLFAEQPIAAEDIDGLAELCRTTSIPIMADESVFTPRDAWRLTAARAADILSVYPGKHGGLAATAEIAHLASAAGIACSIGSNLELGIGTAAMLHVAAALPAIDSVTYPADLLGPLFHEADLLAEPLDLSFAAANPPSGPGLGVVLDEDQLERYRDHSQSAQPLG